MNLTVNNISFQARINKNIAKKAGNVISEPSFKITSDCVSDAAALTPITTPTDIVAAQELKAKRIRKVIEKAIRNNKKITALEISKKTKIPMNQIITIIYRNRFPEIREKFDMVKDKTRLKKPVTDEVQLLAAKMLYDASAYKVQDTDELIEPEKDYIENITNLIQKVKISHVWTPDAIEKYADLFRTAPAFADILISTKNKKGHLRSVCGADNMELLFAINDINPVLTENLLSETADDGNFKYTLKEINRIVTVCSKFPELLELAKQDPQTIYYLFNLSDENGENRFWGNEIPQIYTYLQKYPKRTKDLINDFKHIDRYVYEDEEDNKKEKINTEETNTDKKRNKQVYDSNDRFKRVPKYTGAEILYIMQHYETDPELVDYLVNTRIFDAKSRYSSGLVMEVLKSKEQATKNLEKWVWEDPFNRNKTVFTNKKELGPVIGGKLFRKRRNS